jgi:hypothetical protein
MVLPIIVPTASFLAAPETVAPSADDQKGDQTRK